MAHVAQRRLECREPALIAILFLDCLDVAELDPRPAIGLVARHAPGDLFVGHVLDMAVELVGHLTIGIGQPHRAEQPAPGPADHAFSAFSATKRATMSDAWLHWVTSASSCFCPVLVMR